MAVYQETGNAFLGLRVQAEDARHAAVRDPHLGAGQFPVVKPEPALALAKLANVGEVNAALARFVVARPQRVVGLVVVFIKADRRRRGRRRPAIECSFRPEFEPAGIQKVTCFLSTFRHEAKDPIRLGLDRHRAQAGAGGDAGRV